MCVLISLIPTQVDDTDLLRQLSSDPLHYAISRPNLATTWSFPSTNSEETILVSFTEETFRNLFISNL